jgi:hypothetical protein
MPFGFGIAVVPSTNFPGATASLGVSPLSLLINIPRFLKEFTCALVFVVDVTFLDPSCTAPIIIQMLTWLMQPVKRIL